MGLFGEAKCNYLSDGLFGAIDLFSLNIGLLEMLDTRKMVFI